LDGEDSFVSLASLSHGGEKKGEKKRVSLIPLRPREYIRLFVQIEFGRCIPPKSETLGTGPIAQNVE
jgi:hypothetical protein